MFQVREGRNVYKNGKGFRDESVVRSGLMDHMGLTSYRIWIGRRHGSYFWTRKEWWRELSVRIWRRSSKLKVWSGEWSICSIYRRKIKTQEGGECQIRKVLARKVWIFVFLQSMAHSHHMNILYSIHGDVVTRGLLLPVMIIIAACQIPQISAV